METTELKTRGRGRPASFEGATVAFLAKIPAETRELVRKLASERGEPINVTLNTLILKGHREITRKRG